MATHVATATVTETTTRAKNFIWQSSGTTRLPIGPGVSVISIKNTSTLSPFYWIDHYDSAGVYKGNLAHVQIASQTTYSQGWSPNDLNYANLGVNGDSLPIGTWTIEATFAEAGDPPCAYGTQPTSTGTFVYYLTPALIDTWLTASGLLWLAPVFTAFYFTTLNAQTLCGAGPPPMPAVNLDTLEASFQTAQQMLFAIAWPNLCECKPGSPAPVPFPPPTATQPPGWPSAPTFTCADNDVCATLVQIQQQLAALAQTVGGVVELTTLLQRYTLPFAYIQGARHANLAQEGSFQVPRCVGLLLEVTRTEDPPKVLEGTPPYLWNQGWVSVADANGFIEEKRLHTDRTLWFPATMADVQVVGWWAYPGTQIAITELYAEP